METPLVALLVAASERALAQALEALDAAGFPGLTPSHALAIQLVEAGVVTTRDISLAMRMTPQAVSAIADQLEARGFVARQRSEADARAKTLSLTANGTRLAAAIAASLAAVEREWSSLIGQTQYATLLGALGAWVQAGEPAQAKNPRGRRRRVRIS
jgi:DNA-binding MarR family transcriptional regulator